jgi:hypothetical protein
MAFMSYEQVMKILKQTEGKTFLEAMDSYDWSKGFTLMDTPSCGDGAFEDRIRRQDQADLERRYMKPGYMPSPDEWRRMPDRGLTGDFHPSQETKPAPIQKMTMDEYQRMVDLAKQIPPQGYLLADLPNDPKTVTPPLPSTSESPLRSVPKSVEPDKDHIWNMIVLAAQSSRYGS